MDIVTQGVIGATFAQSFSQKKSVKLATLAGFLGGLAPDADGFIRSTTDTLLSIEFHRHFTHSIFFIPFGALIPALIVWLLLRRKENFWPIYGFSFLGFATHGILDACTSYGTRLFIPFSYERIAWDNVAIIDPFFTLPLIIAMLWVLKNKNTLVVRSTIAICICYLYFGTIQRDRAIDSIRTFSENAGEDPYDIQAKPTIGQLFLWKVIYKTKNTSEEIYNVKAIRLGIKPFFETKIYKGESAPSLNIKKYYASLDPSSLLYKDILRFQDFSSDMLILMPDDPNTIGDVRYSLLPTQIKPLWGITVDTSMPQEHAVFASFRNVEKRDWSAYWSMIIGTHPTISHQN